ncbi:MAG: hypothetical protein AAFZ52_15175, partial [Bacteroidota bacterium]
MLSRISLTSAGLCLLLFAGLSSCKTIDIRTDYALANTGESDAQKGRRLLDETYYAMGYDKLAATKTYSVHSRFDWRMPWTMMPMNALPGNKNNEILFR